MTEKQSMTLEDGFCNRMEIVFSDVSGFLQYLHLRSNSDMLR
jgi:hypothetical protein